MEARDESDRNPIRVVLADDHVLVRQGIRQFLELDSEMRVVAEADDGLAALTLVAQWQPDVLILDIHMPKLSGIEVTRRVKQHHPQVKVLILTAYDDDPYILALLKAGADGYLLKTARAEDVVQAVRDVFRGEMALSTSVAVKLARQWQAQTAPGGVESDAPTPRELAVLRLAAQGLTSRAIGQELGISARTVEEHLANLYRKLQVNSRTEAVTEAIKRGWIVLA